MLFVSGRAFQVWDYNVSHKQLLIRSPASPDLAGNVDLVFWQVEFVAIPTAFHGLAIDLPTKVEKASVEKHTGESPFSKVFCLETGKLRHLVVAGGFKALMNELDIFDSTLVYFGVERPAEWYGKIVAQS